MFNPRIGIFTQTGNVHIMETPQNKPPLAYFITFTTYGTWLPGDKRGSVTHHHNKWESARLINQKLYAQMQKKKRNETLYLNSEERKRVMHAIRATCQQYDWHLYAIHVRSNHFHIVVQSELFPETIMTRVKAYASRAVNQATNNPARKLWSRHGSIRYIWSQRSLVAVMQYVIEQQGRAMACYYVGLVSV